MTAKKFTIAIVFGTRPEITKLAPLIMELQKNNRFILQLISTGQHDELLKESLKSFQLKVNINLDIMTKNQTLTQVLIKATQGLDNIYHQIKPNLTVVLGDTSSTFAAALISFYHQIPVAHIEAGMRSGRMYEPFPEEANRKFISAITTYFFPATPKSRQNLLNEGYDKKNIYMVGSTEIDALQWILRNTNSNSLSKVIPKINILGKIILITTHRRESWGEPLEEVFKTIKQLAINHKDLFFIHSAHPNPLVFDRAQRLLHQTSNILVLPHVEFMPFVHLISRASLILTDSGGIQVDAAALNKPVLILRNVTEWSEIVDNGLGKLVGTNNHKIIESFTSWVENKWPKKSSGVVIYPPGAAKKICSIIQTKILK